MKPFRTDSLLARTYNSGLVVFLYDEAHAGKLISLSPTVLEYYNNDVADESKIRKIAKERLMVAFELQQDDDIQLEVAVGSPLTAEEMGDLPWMPPVVSRINIPTGRLRVEGYDSLQIGPEEPDEKGDVVQVPPGDYVLTLYRINILELDDPDEDYDGDEELEDGDEEELDEDDEEWGGLPHPITLITLTPVTELDFPADHKAVLTWRG